MTPARVRTLIFILIFLGGVIVGFFGLRAVRAFREIGMHQPPPPAPAEAAAIETDVNLIREWMTIPFISKTYHVPQDVLFDALGIPDNRKNREKSLRRLNREYFPEQEGIVLEKVKAAVLTNQPQRIQDNAQTPQMPAAPTSVP